LQGAGKTTLPRKTLVSLNRRRRVEIVEGDIETRLDADQFKGLGAPMSLVKTRRLWG
jgi:Ni2+-binding GTPase involved in maturation of urease and hydrogenase